MVVQGVDLWMHAMCLEAKGREVPIPLESVSVKRSDRMIPVWTIRLSVWSATCSLLPVSLHYQGLISCYTPMNFHTVSISLFFT